MSVFTKDWTEPDPITDTGIEKVVTLLRSGRLHRYQGGYDHTSTVESVVASYLGVQYCLGLNSGGSALFLALKLAGVVGGTPVLTNSYTLTPVPGAVLHAGGKPVLVDCSRDTFQIDLDSLRNEQSRTGSRHLLLCYMRGKLPDIEGILNFCRERDVILIEDCAHVMGSRWRGRPLGTLGLLGCFSTQTNKLINSGEGGFLVTNREDMISSAIIYSGSYGHCIKHTSRPEDDSIMMSQHSVIPNFSLRMTPLAAILILDQMSGLPSKIEALNRNYRILENRLGCVPHIHFPVRLPDEDPVGSSFQFQIRTEEYWRLETFHRNCLERGVKLAWFGCKEVAGFTSTYKHWRYVETESTELTGTKTLLHSLFDLPLYHTMSWTEEDLNTVADIILEESYNTVTAN